MSDEERRRLLAQRLLQEMVSGQVSEKLGEITRRTKDMMAKAGTFTDEDQREIDIMILGMIREAAGDFHQKMQARISKK